MFAPLVLLLGVVAPAPAPALEVHDIRYGPFERNLLDLWHAKSARPTPLVVYIHGGGWTGGDKSSIPSPLLNFLLDHGVSVASINYRYSTIAPLPAPVYDAARAVQYLRSRSAEWKLNPGRFGAAGTSAGGCSALWLAYHDDLADPKSADPVLRVSSRLSVAVGFSPQTTLDPPVFVSWVGGQVLNHSMIMRAVGAKSRDELLARYAEWGGLLREFSPINHVSRGDPPVLVDFPTMGPLPAPTAGAAIHHAISGVKLKEKADAVGAVCVLRIEDQAFPATPKPEEFLLQHLTAHAAAALLHYRPDLR